MKYETIKTSSEYKEACMQLQWNNAEGQNCVLKIHNEASENFIPNLNGVKALHSFFQVTDSCLSIM